MLDTFAVLRRPAAPQDSVPAAAQLPFVREIAVDYVRRARVLPNGMVVYLIPALDSRGGPLRKRPQRCLARERTALESRLRGTPAQARRAAERMLRARQRLEHQASRVVPPRPGLFVEVARKGGGFGGGGGEVASIRRRGQLLTTAVHGRDSLLISLVPDGIATIDFTFARGHGREPGSTRVYRRVYRRSVAVVHNIVPLTVPRLPPDAFYSRQVWRAADGSVVNVVPAPTAR
jgi:hypothetical protein